MSSHGEKKVYLPAGAVGVPIRAGGDFIFLRASAGPVRVIVDGQPVTMYPGEKRRFDRENPKHPAFDTFTADNVYASPQSVTFVVGEGDYEKIIVSGEIVASAGVSSIMNGAESLLPSPVTKSAGLISAGETVVALDQVVTYGASIAGEGIIFDVFFFDGEFYTMGNANLYQLDTVNPTTHKAVFPLDLSGVTYPGGTVNVNACGVTPGGTVYYKASSRIYKFSLYDMIVSQVMGSEFGINNRAGGFIENGVFYFADDSGGIKIRALDLDTLTYETYEGFVGYHVFTKGDGFLYTSTSGSAVANKYTLNMTEVELGISVIASQGGRAYDPLIRYAATTTNSAANIVWAEARTYYGEIYVENVGDATTRKIALLDEPMEFVPRLTGTLFTGRVIRQLVRAIIQKNNEDYLDLIKSIEYSDGYNTITVNGGSRTLALAGFEDDISILLPSEFTITCLPRLLM